MSEITFLVGVEMFILAPAFDIHKSIQVYIVESVKY